MDYSDKRYVWYLAGAKEWVQSWIFTNHRGDGYFYGYSHYGDGDGYTAWMPVPDTEQTVGNDAYEY